MFIMALVTMPMIIIKATKKNYEKIIKRGIFLGVKYGRNIKGMKNI